MPAPPLSVPAAAQHVRKSREGEREGGEHTVEAEEGPETEESLGGRRRGAAKEPRGRRGREREGEGEGEEEGEEEKGVRNKQEEHRLRRRRRGQGGGGWGH
eukprot:3304993-Rhodomonas_salina.1